MTVSMQTVEDHTAMIHDFDDEPGYSAWLAGSTRVYMACSCGYCGRCRGSVQLAVDDMNAHMAAVEAAAS